VPPSAPSNAVTPSTSNTTNEVPTFGSNHDDDAPPKITIEDSGQVLVGAQGSYCYNGTCADTIGPVDLVITDHVNYQTLKSAAFTVQLGVEATDVTVDQLTSKGEPVCSIIPTKVSATTYSGTLCNTDNGNYLLSVGEQFSGGDSSMVIPVIVDSLQQ